MTDTPSAETPDPGRDFDSIPVEELPPVQPPSAGFIVQLFVVPAVIVTAIVGVWLLFGKLAAGEQDWRQLVAELRSENTLKKWRAAHALGQLLQADERFGNGEERLADNPQIAESLSKLLREQLDEQSVSKDEVKNQLFLAGALGFSNRTETVLPVLSDALDERHDTEVRQRALLSIATIAGRAAEREEPITNKEVVTAVIGASKDTRELTRQTAAFTLGQFPTEAARNRLQVLLNDPNREVRANAAIALTRGDSTAGLPVFTEIFETAIKTKGEAFEGVDEEGLRVARQTDVLLLKNSLKAVYDLATEWSDEERKELRGLLKTLSETYREPFIREEARRAGERLAAVE